MGSLITETPISEVTATLEQLDHLGVSREHLDDFRSTTMPFRVKLAIANLLLFGDKALSYDTSYEHLIDCETPILPGEGWEVVEHNTFGRDVWRWKPDMIGLHRTKNQPKYDHERSIRGHVLREELKGVPAINANVLWYLHDRQWLIPARWRNIMVYFWGTIYRHPEKMGGTLCVFGFQWFPGSGQGKGNWRAEAHSLETIWQRHDYAVFFL